MLAHYGHVCQIGASGCTVRATSVHHLRPSSEAPHLFWECSNLTASCSRCNSSDGGRFGGQRTKQKIQQLHAVIEEQQQLIDQLLDRPADHENSNPRAQPAIR